MERGCIEVGGLESGKGLHHDESVMRNCGSGESFPGQGSALYHVPELQEFETRGTRVKEVRRRVVGNEIEAGTRLHRAWVWKMSFHSCDLKCTNPPPQAQKFPAQILDEGDRERPRTSIRV